MGENPNNPNNSRENTGQGSSVTENLPTQDEIRAYYEKNPSAPTVTTSAPADDYYPGLGSYENTGQGNSVTKDMSQDQIRAYYDGLNNMTPAPRMTPVSAPAPRNATPVYAPAPRMTPLAPAPPPAPPPAPAPAPDKTPSTLWEMDKKYVKTYNDGGHDPVWFYEDDNKKKFPTPMKGFVTKINSSFNPFTKTYIISSDNRSFGVNNVYTTDFDMRSGGGRRKSKKMYKKRNLRKKSKSKSKRRHSHARSHRH
jgi:hypothetical protein